MADQVFITPTRYSASLLPEDHPDYSYFAITIESRGRGTWAVCARGGECLSTANHWTYEPQPSSRTNYWKSKHRFTLEEAKARAAKMLPTMTVNGTSVLDVLRRWSPPPENQEPLSPPLQPTGTGHWLSPPQPA